MRRIRIAETGVRFPHGPQNNFEDKIFCVNTFVMKGLPGKIEDLFRARSIPVERLHGME